MRQINKASRKFYNKSQKNNIIEELMNFNKLLLKPQATLYHLFFLEI